ncbi:unnamed protein product [Cercopithifilaria johnstoni]|uniref:Uncharacterized protein n=1 Tax=Cercopithifilaria johnstoni TaxID=2874296 RepID=A0A8J2LQ16_9BILA|nr:unnamed protein product [Cercopithifilaria johnstoni]
MVEISTKKPPKSSYLNVDKKSISIDLALERSFRKKVLKDLKLLALSQEDFVERCIDDVNGSNPMFISTSTCADTSVLGQKEKECNGPITYPTSCRFCGGMLRAIDKHREDQKLTLQCRHRKCMKFNGLTADEQAKQLLSKMAKPRAPQIDYGWYLSDPVRHSYRIFASSGDSSDLEVDRSNVDVRPIIQDGNVMLRVFGQTRLVRLL